MDEQQIPPTESALIRWCITINNPISSKEQWLEHLTPYCKFIILGDEVGEAGTPHIQGYFELEKRTRFIPTKNLLKALDGSQPHLENAKGNKQSNIEYCAKEGDFVTYGPYDGGKGHRTDLDEIAQAVSGGAPMREVALASPATWIRNYRGIKEFEILIQPKPRRYRENFETHFYYGATGAGKTFKAMMEYPNLFKKPIGKSLWFDNLPLGCREVLIDECNGQFPCDQMLQLMDKYEIQVEVKGSHRYLDLDLLILSSNTHPHTWYDNFNDRDEHAAAFCRRLTKVFWFKSRQVVVELDTREAIEEWWENYTPIVREKK